MPVPDRQPLSGKRVLVTRPAGQASDLIWACERLGAAVIHFPTIELAPPLSWAPLAHALRDIELYDWTIFTSVNGIRFVRQYLESVGQTVALFEGRRIAAIGPATAQAIQALGLSVHVVPDEYIAEAIAHALGDVAGQRILLPRAAQAREALALILRQRGARVDEVAVYQTLPGSPSAESLAEVERGVDIATFTSSSTVRNFFALLGDRARPALDRALIACIGPITAETAREYGLTVGLVAETYTVPGLIEAIVQAIPFTLPPGTPGAR